MIPASLTPEELRDRLRRFRRAYALHRAREGRGVASTAILDLPEITTGPWSRQWGVRARTFRRFVTAVLERRVREVAPRAVRVLDLGAGNGWLCYRICQLGHRAVALDLRTDAVDGLGAAQAYRSRLTQLFPRVAAAFEATPLANRSIDIAVFNASLHYALDLRAALGEAARVVVPGGRIAVLDSPVYTQSAAGEAMVAEKHETVEVQFGDLAADLTALPFLEYLTRERLSDASAALGFAWRRHRVRYPLWYELRPVLAWLRRQRPPSRFDLWEATVP